MKCTEKQEVEQCDEFDAWFGKCNNGTSVYLNNVRDSK